MSNNTVKQRHGFTTFWLILMALSVVFGFFGVFGLAGTGAVHVPILISAITCQAIAVYWLFRWNKLGFGQYIASLVGKLIFVALNGPVAPIAIFFFALDVLILWAVLQLKANNGKTCWEQLEISGVTANNK